MRELIDFRTWPETAGEVAALIGLVVFIAALIWGTP